MPEFERGSLLADVRHDFVQTINQPVRDLGETEITAVMAAQERKGRPC